MPPRWLSHCSLFSPADQAVEHAVQLRAVIGLLVVEDHQVDQEAPAAQVAVDLQRFAHQVELGGVIHLHQQDRDNRRNAKAPQPGLAQAVGAG